MKTQHLVPLIFIFSLLAIQSVRAQVPQPTVLSLKGYGGNTGAQVLTNVTPTNDGGFIIALNTNSYASTGNIDSFCNWTGDRNIFLKYDSTGTILEWSKCSTYGDFIYPQNDGSFIYGGATSSVPSGWAFKIEKVDPSGTVLWYKTYGGQAASAILIDMVATNDGGYLMLGETNYSDSDFTIHYGSFMNADFAVLKLDSNGNKIWANVIGGTGYQSAEKILEAPNDGCYILGSTTSNDYDCTGNHGNADAYIARLDKNGNILWHNDLGGSGHDGGGNGAGGYACYDGKGGVLFVTTSNSNDGNVTHQIDTGGFDIWLLDIDSNNNIIWNTCYGGGGYEIPNSVCKARDNSIWIAGRSNSKGGEVDTNYGNTDAWIVHADSTGNFINAKVLGSSRADEGTMIYPLSDGNIIAGGYYSDSNGVFSSNYFYCLFGDAFLSILAPSSTGLNQISTINNVAIFPNPASEILNIINEIPDACTLIINDIIGKQVYKSLFRKNTQIQVTDWQRGIYFVHYTTESGYHEVCKLIVQ